MINRLRWHLVTIAPEIEAQIGPAALKGPRVCAALTRQLARLPQSARLTVAKRLLRRVSEIGREERQLLTELTGLIDAHTPQLLAQPGCGTVTAAIIIGHTAGAQRFPTDGHFARHTGTAPIPASSGNTQRHRLDRGGDRQLNRAIHIIALSRARTDPDTRLYLARKHAEGKTKRDAIRCLSMKEGVDVKLRCHGPRHESWWRAGRNSLSPHLVRTGWYGCLAPVAHLKQGRQRAARGSGAPAGAKG